MIVIGVIYYIVTALFYFLLDVDVNTFLIPPDHFSFFCFAKTVSNEHGWQDCKRRILREN